MGLPHALTVMLEVIQQQTHLLVRNAIVDIGLPLEQPLAQNVPQVNILQQELLLALIVLQVNIHYSVAVLVHIVQLEHILQLIVALALIVLQVHIQ